LDIAAYTITQAQISKAIIDAHNRGVRVRNVMDRTQTDRKYSAATPLRNAGIDVWVTAWQGVGDGIMHHKFATVDGETIITDSVNWSRAGDETNDEDSLIICGDAEMVKAYNGQYLRLN